MKAALKQLIFRLLGKDPEAIVVTFATGDPELFTAYGTLALDAKSVVTAHIDEMIHLMSTIIADGVREGTFRAVDPKAMGRAVLVATSKFHHPAHAAEWGDTAIDAAYEDVWQLLMDGLRPQ